MQQLQYRFFQGKQGARGFIRETGESRALFASGLTPGRPYVLYGLPLGERLGEKRPDGEGGLCMAVPDGRAVFLACGEQVALWEGEAAGYCLSCDCLRRIARGEDQERTAVPPREAEKSAAEEYDRAADSRPPSRMADLPRENAPAWMTREANGENPEGEREQMTPPQPTAVQLRPAGNAPPVDALPRLVWPAGTEMIRRYFFSCPPIRPFDEAGWRFVRAPSPLRQATYCVLGCRIAEDRVTEIAYAVPGSAYRPPAPLPGYRFRMGNRDVGYWVLWKKV